MPVRTPIFLFTLIACVSAALADDIDVKSLSQNPEVQKQISLVAEKLTVFENNTRSDSPPVVYTVGADVACHYNSIQPAVNVTNNNQPFEIRVAGNKTYTENITIQRNNLKLIGGFNNCTDAQNNISNNDYTTIEGDGATKPVLVLINVNPNVQYYNDVVNFDISLGTGMVGTPAGGISVFGNRIDVELKHLLIHNNIGIDGGGLYVQGNQTTVYANDVLVILNEADNGGGVYCDDASILMYGHSGVSLNTANGTFMDGNGGGLYATNGCAFDMFSGTTGGFLDFRGFSSNHANRRGGGLYLEQAAIVNLWGNLIIGDYGDFEQPINVNANESNLADVTGSGGGIYATGLGTQVNAYATIIKDNVVRNSTGPNGSSAGAVYLGSDAKFSLSRFNLPCWDVVKCNQISDNSLQGDVTQAAGIMAINANVSVKNSWISGHQATETAAFMFGQFSAVTFEGNTFVGNGGSAVDGNQSLFYFWGGDNTFKFNTFADNELNNSYIQISQNQPLEVMASVFIDAHNTPVLSLDNPAITGPIFDCIMAHEIDSFNYFDIRSVVDDPLFVDAANQNFHLSALSPAIDFCDNQRLLATTKDMDNESRNWDWQVMGNAYGTYDLGADEYYPETTADISVNVTLAETAPFYKNQLLHYTVTVSNQGPDVATNIQLATNTQRLQFIEVQPICTLLDCVIDSLPVNQDQVYQVTAKILQAGAFDLSSSVVSDDYDPAPSDNADTTGNGGVAIEEFADLSVVFELITAAPYHSGQVVTYQATVNNHGPEVARNVVFDNFFQTTVNMTTISVQSPHCADFPCERALMPANTDEVFIIEAEIIAGQSFNYAVDVYSDSTDTDLNNNRSDDVSQVANPSGDLSVTTFLHPAANYEVGQTVTFDVVYGNAGPSQIGLLNVDVVFQNLTVSGVTGGGCNVLPCQPNALISGESRTITVTAVITAAGHFGLTGNISSGNVYDPDHANNQSSIYAVAGVNADLIFTDGFE